MSTACAAQQILERKYAEQPRTRMAQLMFRYSVTVREVSDATGITPTVLHGLRHGNHRMSLKNAETLAAFFGVSVDEIRGRW